MGKAKLLANHEMGIGVSFVTGCAVVRLQQSQGSIPASVTEYEHRERVDYPSTGSDNNIPLIPDLK
jgi:hypothetical protein